MIVDINTAADILNNDGVVAIPTETVYGLAARMDCPEAIKNVFAIKNRPLDHPLIVHIGTTDWLDRLTCGYPSYVKNLIETFWPGPLTLVLHKSGLVDPIITGGQETVAIRMPSQPTCLTLLNQLKWPIVAPSANPYSRISPTQAAHVLKYFADEIAILDGGTCSVGIESTIILATDPNGFEILRPGIITQDDIEKVAGVPCINNKPHTIKIPGNKLKHYAPKIPVIKFNEKNQIREFIDNDTQKYFFILLSSIDTLQHDQYIIESNPKVYAQMLYQLFHTIEEHQYDAIIIELPTNANQWHAIIDKINRACHS